MKDFKVQDWFIFVKRSDPDLFDQICEIGCFPDCEPDISCLNQGFSSYREALVWAQDHLRGAPFPEEIVFPERVPPDAGRIIGQQGAQVSWEESGFSGDTCRLFGTPAEMRWDVSVNRYGPPIAKLFLMTSHGGGKQVAEIALTASESDPEDLVVRLAKEWAVSIIEDGTADRLAIFGPPEDPDE